jgi:hypothetical protein
MKEEYTAETYPSFGKKYNGEKAIISLTSWRARINTVAKTIYSLIKQCPGFHIVLVLSEEAIFCYKVDNVYAPQSECSIRFDDPTLNIQWPIPAEDMNLSKKDTEGCAFSDAVLFD